MSLLHSRLLSIVYLDRNSLLFFTEKGQQFTFQFPPGTVKELEIINVVEFTKGLQLFIQSQKIPPATVMIILSPDILYEKEFLDPLPNQSQADVKGDNNTEKEKKSADQIQTQPVVDSRVVFLEERSRQIQLFLDTIPFEEIASKNYKILKGIKVVATNKTFYETVITIFAKQLFLIDAVVPFTVLDKGFTTSLGITAEKVKAICKRYEDVKHNSLLEENRLSFDHGMSDAHHIQMTTKITTKREIALVSVFGCLLLILGGMTYMTFFSPVKNRKVASVQQPRAIPTVVPTITLTPTPDASASAALDKEKLKIFINGGTALQQNLLKQDFINNGFTDVSTKPSTIPATGKALIVFSSQLSQSAKEIILEQIKQSVLNVSVQEADSPEADVVINL